MDSKEIISTGILELYAAGIASEEEASKVEQWVMLYPDVKAELAAITAGIEAYALHHSVLPDPSVKQKLFARIQSEGMDKAFSSPVLEEPGRVPYKISVPFWKLVAAASVLLLCASIALNISTYNKYNRVGGELLAARQELTTLEEQNKLMEAGMSVVQNKYSVPVALKGLEAAPDAAAKIFWMRNTGEVFIDASNLPATPVGKQYQLWAIVDGKPVDGGMILTAKTGDKYRMQKMKSFGSAEAFAITLEQEQGSPTPQGPMFVMGKM